MTEDPVIHAEAHECKVVIDFSKNTYTLTVRNRHGMLIFSSAGGTGGSTVVINDAWDYKG